MGDVYLLSRLRLIAITLAAAIFGVIVGAQARTWKEQRKS